MNSAALFSECWIKKNKFTSNMIKKRIDAIEKQDEMPEYAGVTLFFLKKKYRELRNRGL